MLVTRPDSFAVTYTVYVDSNRDNESVKFILHGHIKTVAPSNSQMADNATTNQT
jgi:hypothetical protein